MQNTGVRTAAQMKGLDEEYPFVVIIDQIFRIYGPLLPFLILIVQRIIVPVASLVEEGILCKTPPPNKLMDPVAGVSIMKVVSAECEWSARMLLFSLFILLVRLA